MKINIIDRVLHIIYTDRDMQSAELENITKVSKIYETKDIKGLVGYNYPFDIVPRDSFMYKYKTQADYVIVYKKGDVRTKLHELRHARYYMDVDYKRHVYNVWNTLTTESKNKVIALLLRMNYKNDIKILLDEFQAYYYTEKPNFFGPLATF